MAADMPKIVDELHGVGRYVSQPLAQQLFQLHGCAPRFPLIGLRHGIVVEGDAVDDGDEE